jgi:hypothetical protein
MTRGKTVLRTIMLLTGAVFLFFWLTGFRYYHSAGIDRDVADGQGVWHNYYRFQWPGDGTLRIGGSGHRVEPPDRQLEPFDLGGVLFRAPNVGVSAWDGICRFSLSREHQADVWATFLIVPGWFPALLSFAGAVCVGRRQSRRDGPDRVTST